MPPIVLQIEVSESGLHAVRDELSFLMAHESTRSEPTAALAYVVIRKLVRAVERAEDDLQRGVKEKEARKPKPTSRDLWKAA